MLRHTLGTLVRSSSLTGQMPPLDELWTAKFGL